MLFENNIPKVFQNHKILVKLLVDPLEPHSWCHSLNPRSWPRAIFDKAHYKAI